MFGDDTCTYGFYEGEFGAIEVDSHCAVWDFDPSEIRRSLIVAKWFNKRFSDAEILERGDPVTGEGMVERQRGVFWCHGDTRHPYFQLGPSGLMRVRLCDSVEEIIAQMDADRDNCWQQ